MEMAFKFKFVDVFVFMRQEAVTNFLWHADVSYSSRALIVGSRANSLRWSALCQR